MKKRDTASNRSDTRMTRIKNGIKIIVTGALLLTASSAYAGIISLPGSNVYTDPEFAQLNIQNLGDETFRVHSSGLTGELTIQGSDFPPEYDVPTTAKVVLSFDQELELVINLSTGVVEGRASGQYINSTELWDWRLHADVQGNASCLPLNGLDCGQLVVDLELQGVLSDPNDPSKVGQLRMKVLGSLVWDDTNVAHWAAISANTTIGGNDGLINSLVVVVVHGDANLDG